MSSHARILVVDDDAAVVSYMTDALGAHGYRTDGVVSAAEALVLVERDDYDLVISDVEMPGMRGIDLLKAIHALKPDQLVLLITAFGSIDLAVRALREGACDFVAKPFQIEVLCHAIERSLRERQMRREIVRLRKHIPDDATDQIIARSSAMRRVLEMARRAARTESTVLLTGESGTGKGAIARFIQEQSRRADGPFVQVNCAAVPAALVESELFGVRRGAFTDAREDRPGLFVEAHGGTLFLDEIGEMPLESQPKLLHALETGRVRPVGGGTDREVDLRLIAATNRPLEIALRERRFRPDLYYRLNVIQIELPPLRERREDIEAFVDLFLSRSSFRLNRKVTGVSAEAMRWILCYDWPGNVRELANVLERAVALTDHDTILAEDLPTPRTSTGNEYLSRAASNALPLEEVERAYIEKVLAATGGNRAKAARILGIDRRTLYRKLAARGEAAPEPASPGSPRKE